MFAKLEGLEKKYMELEQALAQPDVYNDQDQYRKLTKAHADLRDVVELFRRHRSLTQELEENKQLLHDSDPDIKAMAQEEIAAAETATGPTESLQKENGETGFTLEHTLGDYDQEERMVEYAALREALRQLPERERQVIALRFYHGLTQQRAAGILHISQVQVSRLERRAVERLREWLAT